MSEAGQAVAFAASLYWQRAATAYNGHVRRDPMALLNLRQGRADPYPIYERIRAGGPLVPTGRGNCVLALLGHREQWQDVCADPQNLAARAIEETLRFDPPVQLTDRVALEPADLEGHAIRPGQRVFTLIGGANRDPEVYPEPATFDIHREAAADHLAFSSGIHYCLGQPLARLEATIALRMLAERMPGLALAGPVQHRNTTTIRGPLHLPVAAGLTAIVRAAADAG